MMHRPIKSKVGDRLSISRLLIRTAGRKNAKPHKSLVCKQIATRSSLREEEWDFRPLLCVLADFIFDPDHTR